jgi:hypothetical protein
VLAGATEERLDDLVRLRLVVRMDDEIAAVPWVMTGLPLSASGRVLAGLRQLGRLQRMAVAPHEAAPASDDAPAAGGHDGLRGLPIRAARGLYHGFYRYGDERADWLRGPSRDYLRAVLLSPRTSARGIARPAGVLRLLEEHDAGKDHAYALSILLGLELWCRQFADGDGAPAEVRAMASGDVSASGRAVA